MRKLFIIIILILTLHGYSQTPIFSVSVLTAPTKIDGVTYFPFGCETSIILNKVLLNMGYVGGQTPITYTDNSIVSGYNMDRVNIGVGYKFNLKDFYIAPVVEYNFTTSPKIIKQHSLNPKIPVGLYLGYFNEKSIGFQIKLTENTFGVGITIPIGAGGDGYPSHYYPNYYYPRYY